MNQSTRRGFLAVAGAGTLAGVAAVAIPNSAEAENVALPSNAEGSMVAYIHDVKKGEAVVMVEGREVTITDKALVARLAHAFAQASRA